MHKKIRKVFSNAVCAIFGHEPDFDHIWGIKGRGRFKRAQCRCRRCGAVLILRIGDSSNSRQERKDK